MDNNKDCPGFSDAEAPPPDTEMMLYSLSRESFLTLIWPGGAESLLQPKATLRSKQNEATRIRPRISRYEPQKCKTNVHWGEEISETPLRARAAS